MNIRTMNSVNMISLTLVALISMATTSFGGVASNSFLTASDQSRLVGIFQVKTQVFSVGYDWDKVGHSARCGVYDRVTR